MRPPGSRFEGRSLSRARGSAGLLRALALHGHSPRASDLWAPVLAVTSGTHAFAMRIVTRAGRRFRLAVGPLPVRVPVAADRTDPEWYRTRARSGSVRLELLRAFKRLAVAELPLVEGRVGRRPSAMFVRRAREGWDARLPARVAAGEFRRAAKRWLQLVTGKATWLALRLAEVAVRATGDAAAAGEVLAVCAAVAARRRLYDPFNTFAAFLEAFHVLAKKDPARLGALVAARRGGSAFRRIALSSRAGKRWRSDRARRLIRS